MISRIDFGKHKFGGPFTEEEVEDVKTIFRLTPLLVFLYGVVFFCELNLSQISLTMKTINCVTKFRNFNDLCFVLIPVYRFIVYPLARKHMPSFLKMIGAGLILCLVSTACDCYRVFLGAITKHHNARYSSSFTVLDTSSKGPEWNRCGSNTAFWSRVCYGSDSKQNERNSDGTGDNHNWLEHYLLTKHVQSISKLQPITA